MQQHSNNGIMDLTNFQTGSIGFMSSSVVSFMHLQDIVLAFFLGMIGALGAFVFKKIVKRYEKR
tara:strand:+ start:801 stop:992 length:192 start_codon:yes stop_codon:yes gene_type:complete